MSSNSRKRFKKIFSSIFTKLLLIIFASGLLIHLLVSLFFEVYLADTRRASLIKNLNTYSEYIIKDIGNPPDLKIAKRINEDASLGIEIEGNGVTWSSSDRPLEREWMKHLRRAENAKFGFHKGKFIFETERYGYKYLFYYPGTTGERNLSYPLYFLLTSLSIILALAYLLIRKTLKPVKDLSHGVKEAASGNFNYRVPVYRNDELGRLADSFNIMNEKIGNMIKAKQQLLLDVSHELRSPLTRIKVALEFIADSKSRDSINEDIIMLETMLSEILETESLNHEGGRLKKEEFILGSFIYDLIQEYGYDGKVVIKNTGVNTDKTLIKADRSRLRTVLKNVLENSLKYSDPASNPVQVSFMNRAGTSVIEIRDYGTGILENELPFVFEPFYRVDRSRSKKTGGYGLGLSLCKTIVEAHGGEINIKSEYGSGTTVTISIPS